MRLDRIHISADSRNKLSVLRARTGLPPDVLCRVGFMLSLAGDTTPELDVDIDNLYEFYPVTPIGKWAPLILVLFEEWCIINGIRTDEGILVKYFRAHLNRGVDLLYGRVKRLEDLVNLL